MENPFELILERLDRIERAIAQITIPAEKQPVDELMDLKEVAAYLKIATSSIYRLPHTNSIPHYKKAKKLIFKKSEIDKWLFATRRKTRDEIQQEALEYLKKRFKH